MKVRPLVVMIAVALASHTLQASTLSPRVYKQLTQAYELREEKEIDEAHSIVRRILGYARLTDYERAQTWLLQSDLYLLEEKFRQAIAPMRQALDLRVLKESRRGQIYFTLGQLYSHIGEPARTIELMEPWIRNESEVPLNAYFVLAAAYLQEKKPTQALRYAERGHATDATLNPAQYQFLTSLYVRQSLYVKARESLQEALAQFPRQLIFWKQLSYVHLQTHQEAEAMNVLRLAYTQGLLERGEDLLHLAQLMRLQNLPWLATQVTEHGINNQKIEPTAKNWSFLGESWVAAREYARAYTPLRKAAELSAKPRDWLHLARLASQNSDWEQCQEGARQALTLNPEDPGPVQLTLGICAYESGAMGQAREAFTEAEKSTRSSTATQAREWMRFVQ